MTKDRRRTTILSTLVCLIPIIAGIILYSKLPDRIAIHWDINGEPNGWAGKFTGAIIFPGILLLINLFFPVILKLDPKYNNVSEKVKDLVQWIIPAVALFASTITLAAAIGMDVKVHVYAPLFVGLLFVVLGNYLPKMKQSYMVGIKIPWTLNDEENWNKTHRLAGFLWVVCGIALMVGAFFHLGAPVLIGCLIVMVAVPIVYSFLLYRGKRS